MTLAQQRQMQRLNPGAGPSGTADGPVELPASDLGANDRSRVERDTLKEVVDIDGHVAFIERVLQEHTWDVQERTEMTEALLKIKAREKDRRLFLGVVGEFNAGKSTLINALLRDELLKTDVIPETTAAATVLSFGPALNVVIRLESGELLAFDRDQETLRRKWPELPCFGQDSHQARARRFLNAVTAEEALARQIRQVSVFHPARVLQDGLVIVDTPGTNARNDRHVEVTGGALRQVCDGAIVIIPGDVPASVTLLNFLREHLADVLHRCVFVLTKFDRIPAGERDRLLDHVRQRLERELRLSSARVLAVSPQIVLEELVGTSEAKSNQRLSTKERAQLVETFVSAEQQLWSTLGRQRHIIQIERVALLLSRFLQRLEGKLRERSESYGRRHEALERNRIPDLQGFLSERKDSQLRDFRGAAGSIMSEGVGMVGRARKKARREIEAALDAAQNRSELQAIAQTQPSEIIEKVLKKLGRKLKEQCWAIAALAQQHQQTFGEEFKKIYQNLATLEGEVQPSDGQLTMAAGISSEDFDRDFSELRQHVSQDQSDAGFKTGAGAVAGVVVGTIILGPLGAIAGGFLGKWIGSSFGPPLSELRHKYMKSLRESLDSQFGSLEIDVEMELDAVIAAAALQFEKLIDAYFEKYQALTQSMIQRDLDEQKQLQRLRSATEATLADIAVRNGKLTTSRERLKTL